MSHYLNHQEKSDVVSESFTSIDVLAELVGENSGQSRNLRCLLKRQGRRTLPTTAGN